MTTHKKARVLIVEDDMRISELHQRFVEKLPDFEVVGIANSIADATDMVEVLQPDLVLLDLFFPVGNGMDLLKQLRNSEQPCDVILITAAREMSSLQEALHRGVFDYIIKPVFFRASRKLCRNSFSTSCNCRKVVPWSRKMSTACFIPSEHPRSKVVPSRRELTL